MNIVQICQYKYPGQVEIGNISFRKPEDEILIAIWNVPNEPRPTEEDLLAYAQEHKRAIEINALSLELASTIQYLIEQTAKSKSYENAVSCASYANSTNEAWKLEADTFIAWRDSVWSYAYEQLAIYSSNEEPLPSVEQFMVSLPQIQWPD
jgi:hypothetical protein